MQVVFLKIENLVNIENETRLSAFIMRQFVEISSNVLRESVSVGNIKFHHIYINTWVSLIVVRIFPLLHSHIIIIKEEENNIIPNGL